MSCCCGHDYDHHHEDASICVCGQPMGEGVGHSRSMGRAGFAVAGGFLILNSFLLEWLFPAQEFASELSAVLVQSFLRSRLSGRQSRTSAPDAST